MPSLVARSGFVALQYREYRLFWLAAAFSNVGMWALVYGRLWLMHDLTGSPVMVGLVVTTSLGPVLLLSVWGGVIADRVNRLKLVRSTRSMFSALTILMGLLIITGYIQPWHVLAISVLTGILLSFDIPSRSAMLPALVPQVHLASAVALYSIVFGAAGIIGPAILSPLVDLWGLEGVFFLIGTVYALTVAALLLMDPSGHRPENRPTTMVSGLLAGFRYLRNHRAIRAVILIGVIVGVFGNSFEVLLPVFSDNILSGGISTYSRLLLFAGVGGLVATLTVSFLGTWVHPVRFFVISGTSYGIGIIILSQVTWFPAAASAIGLIGAFHVVFETMSITLVLSLSAEEFRGRVSSIHQFSWSSTALGGILMGSMAQLIGVSSTLGLSGAVVVASTIVITFALLRPSSDVIYPKMQNVSSD